MQLISTTGPLPSDTYFWQVMAIVLPVAAGLAGWFLRMFADGVSQKRLFDHRLRLEKEYALCSELWERLFGCRRSLNRLVNVLSQEGSFPDPPAAVKAFNDFQSTVRRGEPFMHQKVYDPAREIVRLAREVISKDGEIADIYQERARGLAPEADEAKADMQIKLRRENDTAIRDIEELYECVGREIRRRISL